jgi:hypothetical protein
MFWREIYAFMRINPKYQIGKKALNGLVAELKSKEIMNNQPF